MTSTPRTRLSRYVWHTLLVLCGGVGAVYALVKLINHQPKLACGTLIAGRWSTPTLLFWLLILLIGGGLLLTVLFASHHRTVKLAQNLTLIAISTTATILLVNYAMQRTEPPRRRDRLRYDAHETLGYFTGSSLTFEYQSAQNEYRQTFTTDTQGLIRDPRPVVQGRADIDVMFIGDSFVAGWQVAPEENMSHHFTKALSELSDLKVSTANLGVNGYSPIHYRLVYEHLEAQFQPDLVVVVLFVGNDFGDTAAQLQAGNTVVSGSGDIVALRSPERPDPAIFNPWAAITDAAGHPYLVPPTFWERGLYVVGHTLIYRPLCQSLEWQHTGPAIYDFRSPTELDPITLITPDECASDNGALCTSYPIRHDTSIAQNYDAIFKDTYTDADLASIEISLDQLRQLAAQVRDNDQTLVIAIMPDGNQLPNQAVGVKPHRGMQPDELIESTAPQDLLRDFCQAESLHCLDLLPEFQQHSDEQLYWVYDTHLTARGQALAGEAIAAFIYSEGLLDTAR